MSEAWANITLKIPCSIEAEARMISCFLANKEMHPEIPIKLDAVVTRGDGPYGGWGVTAWLSDSEVFRSFDDDLQELCDAVFKQFPDIKDLCLLLQHAFENGVVLPGDFHGKDVAVEGVTDVPRNHTFQLTPRTV